MDAVGGALRGAVGAEGGGALPTGRGTLARSITFGCCCCGGGCCGWLAGGECRGSSASSLQHKVKTTT